MKPIIPLLALLLSLPSFAYADKYVLSDPSLGKIAVDTSKACTDKQSVEGVKRLGEDPSTYRQALVVYENKPYPSCAKVVSGGICIVVGELGHVDLPIDAFKKLLEVKK